MRFDKKVFKDSQLSELSQLLSVQIHTSYSRRAEALVAQAWPILKNIYETQRAGYENVVVPVGDGNGYTKLF